MLSRWGALSEAQRVQLSSNLKKQMSSTLKKGAVKHSPLDLVRRVPDEAATLSLAKGNIS
jgi:hypothetical protein